MAELVKKRFDSADRALSFDWGKVGIVQVGDLAIRHGTLKPGWKLSEYMKPMLGTHSCQVPHTGIVVSGRLHVRMEDGSEQEYGPGDAFFIPPGHDAWAVGDEPFSDYSMLSAAEFAKM